LLFNPRQRADPWKVTMRRHSTRQRSEAGKDKNGLVSLGRRRHGRTLLAETVDLAGELSNVWAKDAGDERSARHIFASGPLTTGAVDQFVQELSQSNINGKSTSSSNRTRPHRRLPHRERRRTRALRDERARDGASHRQ